MTEMTEIYEKEATDESKSNAVSLTIVAASPDRTPLDLYKKALQTLKRDLDEVQKLIEKGKVNTPERARSNARAKGISRAGCHTATLGVSGYSLYNLLTTVPSVGNVVG